MASAINDGQMTFAPEEVKSLSEVILALVTNNLQINDLHAVETGIKYDQQIVFAGRIPAFGKEITSCTFDPITGLALTQKFWRPKRIGGRLEHCSVDVNAQNKLLAQYRNFNKDFFDIIDGSESSEVGKFLMAHVAVALTDSVLYKVWFSDVDAAHFGEGSGGSGDWTSTVDLDLYNIFDGLWKQIQVAISGVASKYRYTITKNAGNSYANQALAAGDGLAIVRGLFNKANTALRTSGEARILVTRSIYDAILNDLEDAEVNNGGFLNIVDNGRSTLTYRGIEVVMVGFWDLFIDENLNNGTRWVNPHRAVMTTKSNIPVGTSDEESLSKLDAFYDRYHNVNIIDVAYTLDTKLLIEDMIAVAI